ncbi:hypothetical protein OS493_036580 [Desmophyllum pertusum]|uniref:UBX domain-containing protein n=1 Tax=Desmophyllum pertusum TaxID=174260 RepID=A0A9X0CC90_9CNID|nr:hypothetical protein OS493_036580 [Desmophyllum pertusum]
MCLGDSWCYCQGQQQKMCQEEGKDRCYEMTIGKQGDCSQFDFLNCDQVNKRKLYQLDPQSQNPSATALKTAWRSQCPIYIRPHFALPNMTQPLNMTPTTASPGFVFRQNLQSLLQSLSGQNPVTTSTAATHTITTHTPTTHTRTTNTVTTHTTNTRTTPITNTGTTPTTNTGTAPSHTAPQQTQQQVPPSATVPAAIVPATVPAIVPATVPAAIVPATVPAIVPATVPAAIVPATVPAIVPATVPVTAAGGDDSGSPRSTVSVMSLSPDHSNDVLDHVENGINFMNGSNVAIQVSEDMVTLPASCTIQAFDSVQPNMFCAWQNEIYGWQHPNTITLPYELLHRQAAQDMVPIIVYLSNYVAHNIHQDDICRNILSRPEVIQACSDVYFWCIGNCPESTEIQRSLQLPQHVPLVVSITHNAAGTQMAPVVLTNLTSVQEFVDFIHRAVRVQQDQVLLRQSRELVARQNAEYQQGLLIDIERAIRETRNQLPAEPLVNGEHTVNIRLRDHEGNVLGRTFWESDTTQVLFSAAFALLELPSQNFSLRTHDGLIDNNGTSLTELNLTGDVLISVEMLD